ncbi:GNAT family N-acetyltransferase [Luteococcus sp. Sow4_B9]|uniref:GNAT family N-acetyltransferase n=1 Tax=Luteococcus sp. Sow4_B9 TaxID=3438792 RepID=UPI003F99D9D9
MNWPSSAASDPAQWEADVVLADGGIAQLRPITPEDRDAMVAFYSRVSEQSKYLRFFAAHPTLSEQELEEYTNPDNRDRVAILLAVDEEIVAFAHYEVIEQFLPQRVANVAFLVQDDQQGRGVGNILLEHLAQIGRECGVERFTAEMLTQNRRMVQVFTRAGYSVRPELSDGCILVDFPLEATEKSREVMEQREHKAESNAIRGLLTPRRMAVVGEVSQVSPIISSIADVGYRGELLVVTTADSSTESHERSLRQISGDIDLVVVRAGVDGLEELIVEASEKNARGILVLAGTSPAPIGQEDARQLVSWARTHGLRALGPTALGLVNTDPEVCLNASPARRPRRGVVGLFTQTAGVATIVLARAQELGIGLSSFIATGAFADVTGNDVMQYWTDDERTRVCLLSLDSVGNPRKFFRVMRRLALTKPVVVFTPSRALNSARNDQLDLPSAPAKALDQVINQTGAIVVSRRDTMYDIAQLIARQPIPRGRRVRVIANSGGLAHQMAQAAIRFGLEPGDPVVVHDQPAAEQLIARTAEAAASGEVDAVVSAVVEVADPLLDEVHRGLTEIASTSPVPVVGVFVGFRDAPMRTDGDDGMGQLPTFTHYADALQALALVVENENHRERQRSAGEQDALPSGDTRRARAIIEEILADAPEGRWATDAECAEILDAYGLTLVPWRPVTSLEQAVAAAEELGWDVVLKATASLVRGRPELATNFFHIEDAEGMERAWESLGRTAQDLGLTDGLDPLELKPVVQTTMATGTSLTVRGLEDAVLGPMISVGVAGPPSDLLGDIAWGVPPLHPRDARALLDDLQAAPLLHGYRGSRPVDMDAISDVLVRLALLKDDQAALAEIELQPVIASPGGTAIVGGRMRIVPMPVERDPLARRAT